MMALLVSVAAVHEVAAAVAGGASIIDCKDPARGALGAWRGGVAQVCRLVACASSEGVGLRVSAAAGSCRDDVEEVAGELEALAALPLDFIKLGLHRDFLGKAHLAQTLARLARIVHSSTLVAVFFADEYDQRGPPQEFIAVLAAAGFGGVMWDTADKGDRRSLLSCVTVAAAEDFTACVARHRMFSGLAGSLEAREIATVARACPDYVGVRGAACRGGRRGEVCAVRVRALARKLVVLRRVGCGAAVEQIGGGGGTSPPAKLGSPRKGWLRHPLRAARPFF